MKWLIYLGGVGLFGLVIFLSTNHLRHQLQARRDGIPLLSIADTIAIHIGEVWAFLWIGWWNIWGRGKTIPRRPVDNAPVVLCVHGYTQNSTNFWGIRKALLRRGRESSGIFLGFAWPWRRIEGYSPRLEQHLERVRSTGDTVDIVAHSMGGLVVREVLHRRPDLREAVRRVVTIGTPHHGTAMAVGVPLVHPAQQIAFHSQWVEALPTLDDLLPGHKIVTIGSDADMVVFPIRSTTQPHAEHRRFRRAGHAGLLVHRACIDTVVDALTEGSTPPQH